MVSKVLTKEQAEQEIIRLCMKCLFNGVKPTAERADPVQRAKFIAENDEGYLTELLKNWEIVLDRHITYERKSNDHPR